MTADRKGETTPNVVCKIKDTLKHLDEKLEIKSCNSFISDSCNGMIAVRRWLLEKNIIRWEYGCGFHCLNKFCEEVGKTLFKDVIKKSVYFAKTIKNTGMIKKIFDFLSKENFKKTYVIPLYSKTRRSSVNLMLARLKKVSSMVSYMPHAFLHERDKLQLDTTFDLHAEFITAISGAAFWERVTTAYSLFDHICKCIVELESDESTMSGAYTCVLSGRLHIYDCKHIGDNQRQHFDASLIRHWRRIYSPGHSLAFKCDHFYHLFRERVEANYSEEMVDLGKDLKPSCYDALDLFKDNDARGESLLHGYVDYCIKPHSRFSVLPKWHPKMMWGQMQSEYSCFSKIMYNIYPAPVATARIER